MIVSYQGPVRVDKPGTQTPGKIYKCPCCGLEALDDHCARAHKTYINNEYRESVGKSLFNGHFNIIKGILDERFLINKVVCDVGASDGEFLSYAKKYSKMLIAIEPNVTQHKELRKIALVYSGLSKYHGKFDVCVFLLTIEHVDNPLRLLKEIKARLSEGGVLVVTTPNLDDTLLDNSPPYKKFFYRISHLWYFDKKTLSLILKNAGFKNISVKHYHRPGILNNLGWRLFGRGLFLNTRLSCDDSLKRKRCREHKSDYLVAVAK